MPKSGIRSVHQERRSGTYPQVRAFPTAASARIDVFSANTAAARCAIQEVYALEIIQLFGTTHELHTALGQANEIYRRRGSMRTSNTNHTRAPCLGRRTAYDVASPRRKCRFENESGHGQCDGGKNSEALARRIHATGAQDASPQGHAHLDAALAGLGRLNNGRGAFPCARVGNSCSGS
jgi:hypothetical protein